MTRWGPFDGMERLFHGMDKCDHGTINLILEYLTRNGSIIIDMYIAIVIINRILTWNEELDDRGTVNLIKTSHDGG